MTSRHISRSTLAFCYMTIITSIVIPLIGTMLLLFRKSNTEKVYLTHSFPTEIAELGYSEICRDIEVNQYAEV